MAALVADSLFRFSEGRNSDFIHHVVSQSRISSALQVHRQVVSLAKNWPPLQCEPRHSCSGGQENAPVLQTTPPCSCGMGQLLMPALQSTSPASHARVKCVGSAK